MNNWRAIALCSAFVALGACDQSPAPTQGQSTQPAAVEPGAASPAADTATEKDCGTTYFYNFSDQRAGGKTVCSTQQQS